jgi:hypothetical protein
MSLKKEYYQLHEQGKSEMVVIDVFGNIVAKTDTAMMALTPEELTPSVLAARLIESGYAHWLTQGEQSIEDLRELIRVSDRWSTMSHKNGYKYLMSQSGQKLVEVSPRGVSRYFDQFGHCIVELDSYGHVTFQAQWTKEGELVNVHYLSLSGDSLYVRRSEVESFGKEFMSVPVVAATEGEVYSFYSKLGIDFIAQGVLPTGLPNIGASAPLGYGLMLVNLMAKLALDKVGGGRLEFNISLAESLRREFYFILREVANKKDPRMASFEDFRNAVVGETPQLFEPESLDLIKHPNPIQLISADSLEEYREREVLLAIDPTTNKPVRVYYKKRQYIEKSRIDLGFEARDYVVEHPQHKGWRIIRNGQRIGTIDLLGNEVADTDEAMTIESVADQALVGTKKGGIDFNADKINLQIQNSGEGIKFEINPQLLAQLQNAPGFVPVIINISPMTDIKAFLGISPQTTPVLAGV